VRESGTENVPASRLTIQDGIAEGLYLSFDLASVPTAAVSAAFIRLDADTLLLQQNRPAHFVRPVVQNLALYGVPATGSPVQIGEAVFNRDAQAYIFSSPLLRNLIQDALLGRPVYDRFVIAPPRIPVTLNVAPIVNSPERPPRAVLILIPAEG
jgi:hypothetical protein